MWGIVVVFAAVGTLAACVDLRDHWTVDPTTPPAGVEIATSDEPETINEAWRSVEDFKSAANTYIERRNQDIIKEEQKVAFIEGFASSGLETFLGEVGKYGGPFAPLALYIAGRMTKRREDKAPSEVQKEKEASYAAGRKDALEEQRKSGEELATVIAEAVKKT